MLNKIHKGHNFTMGPHMYTMKNKPLEEDSLRVFKQKSWAYKNKTTTNHKLFIEFLTTQFLPPNSLQHQKRYLRQGLFRPWEYKISKFIFWVN